MKNNLDEILSAILHIKINIADLTLKRYDIDFDQRNLSGIVEMYIQEQIDNLKYHKQMLKTCMEHEGI